MARGTVATAADCQRQPAIASQADCSSDICGISRPGDQRWPPVNGAVPDLAGVLVAGFTGRDDPASETPAAQIGSQPVRSPGKVSRFHQVSFRDSARALWRECRRAGQALSLLVWCAAQRAGESGDVFG